MMSNMEYRQDGDYMIPNIVLPEKEYHIGKYGLLRKTFLRKQRKGTYSAMLLCGTLHDHLQEIDELAHDFISRTVSELAAREGVDEALKASDQMEWVRQMNSIKARVEEVACQAIIYA